MIQCEIGILVDVRRCIRRREHRATERGGWNHGMAVAIRRGLQRRENLARTGIEVGQGLRILHKDSELVPAKPKGDIRQHGRGDPLAGGADQPVTGRMTERVVRSEEHTSELQSLMRISYAVFCLKKKNDTKQNKNA